VPPTEDCDIQLKQSPSELLCVTDNNSSCSDISNEDSEAADPLNSLGIKITDNDTIIVVSFTLPVKLVKCPDDP
jgi:hypothetical protein